MTIPTINPEDLHDQCTSFHPPAGLTTKFRMTTERRPAGCANTHPWWTNITAAFLAAAIAAAIAWHHNQRVPAALITACITFISYGLLIDWFDPARLHGLCEICGQCAVHAGVPAARTRKKANKNLRSFGWTVHPDGTREHCPAHYNVPFADLS